MSKDNSLIGNIIEYIFSALNKKQSPCKQSPCSSNLKPRSGINVKKSKVITDCKKAITPLNEKQIEELWSCEKQKCHTSFQGIVTLCKQVDCYDGDTQTIIFYYREQLTQQSVRLANLDCPEIKPKKSGRTKESLMREKEAAVKARNRLNQLTSGKLLVVEFLKCDKYGRPLVFLYHDKEHYNLGKSINQQMVEEGHGVEYDGGKKKQLFK